MAPWERRPRQGGVTYGRLCVWVLGTQGTQDPRYRHSDLQLKIAISREGKTTWRKTRSRAGPRRHTCSPGKREPQQLERKSSTTGAPWRAPVTLRQSHCNKHRDGRGQLPILPGSPGPCLPHTPCMPASWSSPRISIHIERTGDSNTGQAVLRYQESGKVVRLSLPPSPHPHCSSWPRSTTKCPREHLSPNRHPQQALLYTRSP